MRKSADRAGAGAMRTNVGAGLDMGVVPDRVHPGFVTSVLFHPDRRRLLSTSVDGTVNVWDLATGSLAGRWDCHSGPVNALAIEPAERRLLTAGRDRSVALWDLDDGALIRRFSDLPAGALDAVALGGGRVAAACFDGSIGVWEGDGRFHVLDGHRQAVTALCLMGDGRLVSGSRDTTLRSGTSRPNGASRPVVTAIGSPGSERQAARRHRRWRERPAHPLEGHRWRRGVVGRYVPRTRSGDWRVMQSATTRSSVPPERPGSWT